MDTQLIMAIVAVLVALIFVGSATLLAFMRATLVQRRRTIDVDIFISQVQKLILANNIDRAIKLCNEGSALTEAPLSQAVKGLLVRADRTAEEQELSYKEGWQKIQALRDEMVREEARSHGMWLASHLIALASLTLLSWHTWWALLIVVLCFLVYPFVVCVGTTGYMLVLTNLNASEDALIKVRSLLTTRSSRWK